MGRSSGRGRLRRHQKSLLTRAVQTSPCGSFADAVDEWRSKANGRQVIDMGYHMAVTDLREGGTLARGAYGETRVISRDGLDPALPPDQLLHAAVEANVSTKPPSKDRL